MAKIVMVVMNNFISDTRVFKEAKSLVLIGHQVIIIAMKTPQIPAYEEMAGFIVIRLHLNTRRWSKQLFVQSIKYLEFVFKALLKIKQYHPDIIHAHDLPALPIAWLASKITKVKTIYDSHEFWLGLNRPFYKTKFGKRIVRQLEGFLIRRVDAVITINQTISKELAKIYSITPPTVVMNTQPLIDSPSSSKLRSKLGVHKSTSLVIYAASFSPGRGLEQLIESTQYFPDNIILVLMGPDIMNGRLQEYVHNNNFQSRVRFLPPVPQDEVATYVSSADLGIIPSQSTCLNSYYGLGNKIFHYIAAGVPIAVSDQPERKRIVEEFGVGIVFDSSNPKDIASKITRLINNPELRKQMRKRALKAHLEQLNWEKEAEKIYKIYYELD